MLKFSKERFFLKEILLWMKMKHLLKYFICSNEILKIKELFSRDPNRPAIELWYDSHQKGGLQKDGAIQGETLCVPTLNLSKMALHTMCVCAHQYRLVKNGAMHGVWVCTSTQTLSKMAYRHMGLCVCVCGRAHQHGLGNCNIANELMSKWANPPWGLCVCVCGRAHQHGLGNCNSKWANPPWGLGLNPKPNRKLFPDHLPSIFPGVLVGAGSLWHEGSAYHRLLGLGSFPIAQHDS
jgi:hypothetical protein